MIVTALFLTILGVTESGASAGPVDLSARDVARLRAVGMRVAVPGYVPPEFHLIRVEAERCPIDAQGQRYACKFGPSYSLQYAKDIDTAFTIDAVGGGIGDVGDDYRTTVRTALFGQVTLYFGSNRIGFGAMKPSPPAPLLKLQLSLVSEWATATGRKGPFYHITGRRMRPVDVAKVLASLHWLR